MPNRHLAGSLSAIIVAVVFLIAAPVASAQESTAEQIARLKKAVVIITTYDSHGKPQLQGTGFFIYADQIATNFHVVKNAFQIRIETIDREIATVTSILASDEKSDLALLQLGSQDSLTPRNVVLPLKTTAPAEGDAITVISNPMGSHWKITRGCTGLLWEFHGMGERLQISAAISPGSSGGPVIDARGEVVGIATMYFNSIDNLSFAVPVERLHALQLKALSMQARAAGARVEPRVERSGTLDNLAKNSTEPAKRATHLIAN